MDMPKKTVIEEPYIDHIEFDDCKSYYIIVRGVKIEDLDGTYNEYLSSDGVWMDKIKYDERFDSMEEAQEILKNNS